MNVNSLSFSFSRIPSKPPVEQHLEDWLLKRLDSQPANELSAPLPESIDARQAALDCAHIVHADLEAHTDAHTNKVIEFLRTHPDVEDELIQLMPIWVDQPAVARQLTKMLFAAGRDFECGDNFPEDVKAMVAERRDANRVQVRPLQNNPQDHPVEQRAFIPNALAESFLQPQHDHRSVFLEAMRQRDLAGAKAAAQALGKDGNGEPIKKAFERAILSQRTGDVFQLLVSLKNSGDLTPDALSNVLKKAYEKAHQFHNAPMIEMLVDMAKSDPIELANIAKKAFSGGKASNKFNEFGFHALNTMMKDQPNALTAILTKILKNGFPINLKKNLRPNIRHSKE